MAARPRPASALPSVKARALAFAAILVAGAAGAAIGASFVTVECRGDCTTPVGVGAVVGGAGAAGGVGVVATLTLRAMGEWTRIREDQVPDGMGGPEPGDGMDGLEPDDRPAHDGVSSRKPSA